MAFGSETGTDSEPGTPGEPTEPPTSNTSLSSSSDRENAQDQDRDQDQDRERDSEVVTGWKMGWDLSDCGPMGLARDRLAVSESVRLMRGVGGRGFYRVPNVPTRHALGALSGYMPLQPDESVLALIPGGGDRGCAITTRRLYWGLGPAAQAGQPVRAVNYSRIQRVLHERNDRPPLLILDDGSALELRGLARRYWAAVGTFLNTMARSWNEGPLIPILSSEQILTADAELPSIAAWTKTLREHQQRSYRFMTQLHDRTPFAPVTYSVIFACFAVFAWMIATGVSPFNPGVDELQDWGANFGPLTVGAGQTWRLFTCMFLHVGIMHVSMNMWCLYIVGPYADRLFGFWSFALIYAISGVTGGLASTYWHPMTTSAGASGAVFGVFGAVGAFLVIRRHILPAAFIWPLGRGLAVFVLLNVAIGYLLPFIDTAAHIGGLVGGVLSGLVLAMFTSVTRLTPKTPTAVSVSGGEAGARGGAGNRYQRLGWFVACLGLIAGMGFLTKSVTEHINRRDQMPEILVAWFMDRHRPVIEDYQKLSKDFDRRNVQILIMINRNNLLVSMVGIPVLPANNVVVLADLREHALDCAQSLRDIPPNAFPTLELKAAFDALAQSADALADGYAALRWIISQDPAARYANVDVDENENANDILANSSGRNPRESVQVNVHFHPASIVSITAYKAAFRSWSRTFNTFVEFLKGQRRINRRTGAEEITPAGERTPESGVAPDAVVPQPEPEQEPAADKV